MRLQPNRSEHRLSSGRRQSLLRRRTHLVGTNIHACIFLQCLSRSICLTVLPAAGKRPLANQSPKGPLKERIKSPTSSPYSLFMFSAGAHLLLPPWYDLRSCTSKTAVICPLAHSTDRFSRHILPVKHKLLICWTSRHCIFYAAAPQLETHIICESPLVGLY
jgi:hypothetical protein